MIFRTTIYFILYDYSSFAFSSLKINAQAPLETCVAHCQVGLCALPIVPGQLHLLLRVKALGKGLNSLLEGSAGWGPRGLHQSLPPRPIVQAGHVRALAWPGDSC